MAFPKGRPLLEQRGSDTGGSASDEIAPGRSLPLRADCGTRRWRERRDKETWFRRATGISTPVAACLQCAETGSRRQAGRPRNPGRTRSRDLQDRTLGQALHRLQLCRPASTSPRKRKPAPWFVAVLVWNAKSYAGLRGSRCPSARAMQQSGVADGPVSSTVSQHPRACKHKSRRVGAVDQTARFGAKRPSSGS
jgi:hypothetical protein